MQTAEAAPYQGCYQFSEWSATSTTTTRRPSAFLPEPRPCCFLADRDFPLHPHIATCCRAVDCWGHATRPLPWMGAPGHLSAVTDGKGWASAQAALVLPAGPAATAIHPFYRLFLKRGPASSGTYERLAAPDRWPSFNGPSPRRLFPASFH